MSFIPRFIDRVRTEGLVIHDGSLCRAYLHGSYVYFDCGWSSYTMYARRIPVSDFLALVTAALSRDIVSAAEELARCGRIARRLAAMVKQNSVIRRALLEFVAEYRKVRRVCSADDYDCLVTKAFFEELTSFREPEMSIRSAIHAGRQVVKRLVFLFDKNVDRELLRLAEELMASEGWDDYRIGRYRLYDIVVYTQTAGGTVST